MRHDSSLDLALGGGLDDDRWFARLAGYREQSPFGMLGEYVVLAEAGRGGQGVVYKALQPRTRRVIAIKRVTAMAAGSTALRARFEREVRATAALRHPLIVNVLGCDVIGGQLLLLMEYVEGVPADRWSPGRAVRDVVELFERIAGAVAHAHQRGVIHRDLKPSNVLVDSQGEPHVLDFGLARLLSPLSPDSASVTHSGAFIGTPLYASPEHFSSDHAAIDVRSDIYSVGVMLFQCLTGRLPYADSLPFAALMKAIQEHEPRRPSALRPGLGRDLDAIVRKALHKDRGQRYQSMDAFGDDLRRYLTGEAVRAHPPSIGYQFRKLVRRHKLAFASGATILGLLIAFAVTATILALREHAARAEAEHNSYFASLAAATASLRSDDAATALSYLDRAPLALRNWEWRYLRTQADQSVHTLRGAQGAIAVDRRGLPIAHLTAQRLDWTGDRADLAAVIRADESRSPAWTLSPTLHHLASRSAVPEPVGRWFGTLSETRTGRTRVRWDGNFHPTFSPDGQWLALADIGGSTGAIHVLPLPPFGDNERSHRAEVSSPPLTLEQAGARTVTLQDFRYYDIAFSSDGRRFAAQAGEGRVQIVDCETLDVLQTLDVGGRQAWALDFSPDDRTLAVGTLDKRLALWDLHTETPRWSSTGHGELIRSVAFSPSGSRIASASWDMTVGIWDASTGELAARLLGHEAFVNTVEFLDDDIVVSRDSADALKTWRLSAIPRPSVNAQFRRIGEVGGVLCAGGQRWLVIAECGNDVWRDPRVTFVSLQDRSPHGVLWTDPWVWTPTGRSIAKIALAVSRDGAWLAAGGGDGRIRLWHSDDLADWLRNPQAPPPPPTQCLDAPARPSQAARTSSEEYADVPVSLDIDARAGRLAVGRQASGFEVWDLARNEIAFQNKSERAAYGAFGPDGARLFVAFGDRVLMLNAADGTVLRELAPGYDPRTITPPSFSPDGRLVVTDGADGQLILRRASDLTVFHTLSGHTAEPLVAAFSSDGSRLASAGNDNKVRIWDTATGRELLALHGHELLITGVRFLDHDTLVSAGLDNTVRFWDARLLDVGGRRRHEPAVELPGSR